MGLMGMILREATVVWHMDLCVLTVGNRHSWFNARVCKLSIKGQIVNILGFTGHNGLCCNYFAIMVQKQPQIIQIGMSIAMFQ